MQKLITQYASLGHGITLAQILLDGSMQTTFMFATGIENSYPTIDLGSTRMDEMEKCSRRPLSRL